MNWFEKLLPPKIKPTTGLGKRGVPEGLWRKCDHCSAVLYAAELERDLQVCPKCAHHMRIRARDRLRGFLDDGGFEEIGANVRAVDALKFRDEKRYRDRLAEAAKRTGETEALIVARGALKGIPLVAAAFEFQYMGGSMGSVVGERFVRGIDVCLEQGIALVCFAASGGARMQEALFSLLQMAKTASALKRMSSQGLPYISVLTDPTMGGVSASVAMLGDVIVAEPGALIGFAGPRVIEQTVRETLPEGFQRAEFMLEHGAIDMIVARPEIRDTIHALLAVLHPVADAAAQTVEPEPAQAT